MGKKSELSSKIKEGCILNDEVQPEYGFLTNNKKIGYLSSPNWDLSTNFDYFENDDCMLITNIFC